MQSDFSNLIIKLFSTVLGSALFSLILAFLLQPLTKFIAKFKISYLKAYTLTFILLVCFLLGTTASNTASTITVIQMILGFILCSTLFGYTIKHPEQGRIGFIKGTIIVLFLSFILIFVGLVGLFVFEITHRGGG